MAQVVRDRAVVEQEKKEQLQKRFRLVDQPDFLGTPEQLQMMQDAERAYRVGKPVMTDQEWDHLVRELHYVESLDEVVAQSGRKWLQMSAPLVSIKKVYHEDDVVRFMQQVDGPVVITPKLDGCPLCVFYEQDQDGVFRIAKVGSRGDGLNSLELHPCALWGVDVIGLPQEILPEAGAPVNENGRIELRGELVVFKEDYPEHTVLRTQSAGMVNRKNPTIGEGRSARGVTIACTNRILSQKAAESFAWPVGRCGAKAFRTWFDAGSNTFMQENAEGEWAALPHERAILVSFSVSDHGFNRDDAELIKSISPEIIYEDAVPGLEAFYKVSSDPDEILSVIRAYYGNLTPDGMIVDWERRGRYQGCCATDGLVIKELHDTKEKQQLQPKMKGGKMVVPHHPANVIAVKLMSRMEETVIRNIHYHTTDKGNVTVTADLEPFHAEDGKLVSKLNLHNPEWLALPENQYLKEGARIGVVQSGDIISIPVNLDLVKKYQQ